MTARDDYLYRWDTDNHIVVMGNMLDEIDRLRAALTVPKNNESWVSPLTPDDTRYGYVPKSFVLDMPQVQLVVGKGDIRKLAEWFLMCGCDIGVYLLEEIGEEP